MNFRRCAFSLIEVTMVLLVVGVLVAVAAPRFADSLRVMQLEAAARQLAAHVDYIRSVAINEGRSASLICDNNLHTYGCDSVDFPERIGELIQVSIPDIYDPTITLSADFDSSRTLTFDLEGVPHVGASQMIHGEITLAAGNDRFAVIIAAGTGATRVERIEQDPEPGGGGSQGGGEYEQQGPIDGHSGASI